MANSSARRRKGRRHASPQRNQSKVAKKLLNQIRGAMSGGDTRLFNRLYSDLKKKVDSPPEDIEAFHALHRSQRR